MDNKWIYSGRTDLEGKIKMKGLPLGKYYIVEKEAPEHRRQPGKACLTETDFVGAVKKTADI